jgi:hypothetical protein
MFSFATADCRPGLQGNHLSRLNFGDAADPSLPSSLATGDQLVRLLNGTAFGATFVPARAVTAIRLVD